MAFVSIGGKDFFRIVKELPNEIVKRKTYPPGAYMALMEKKVVEGIFHHASFVLGYSQCLMKSS
jgi:hypothetical protein